MKGIFRALADPRGLVSVVRPGRHSRDTCAACQRPLEVHERLAVEYVSTTNGLTGEGVMTVTYKHQVCQPTEDEMAMTGKQTQVPPPMNPQTPSPPKQGNPCGRGGRS